MNEWLISLNLAPWVPVAAAFLGGIVVGWLLFGGHESPDNNLKNEQVDVDGEQTVLLEGGDDAQDSPSIDDDTAKAREASKALFSKNSSENDDDKNKAMDVVVPDSMKLGALESELRKAQELLAEAKEEKSDFAEHINELDGALARANNNIKMVLKAVKKAKPGT